MTLSLMCAFGTSAGGGFYDDTEEDPINIGGEPKTTEVLEENPFIQIQFAEDECPESFLEAYEEINTNIRLIQRNNKNINILSKRFGNSTQMEDTDGIMKELHLIIAKNNQLAIEIKKQLETENFNNANILFRASNIGRWCANKLNTSVRSFKISVLEFSKGLNSFNTILCEKRRRHLDILDNRNQLSEQEKDEMAVDYDRTNQYIEDLFTLNNFPDRKLGNVDDMRIIEKSLKDLSVLRHALEILITFEEQEMSDYIIFNVNMTRDFIQEAADRYLVEEEEYSRCSRKCILVLCCCCSLIFIIVFVSVFVSISEWNAKQ